LPGRRFGFIAVFLEGSPAGTYGGNPGASMRPAGAAMLAGPGSLVNGKKL